MSIHCINSFADGTVVTPVNLGGIMKNLKIVRVTDSCVLVDGWHREDEETGWSRFHGYIAPTVQCRISEIEEAPIDGASPQKTPPRIKKEKIEIEYPEKFTIKELSLKYPEISKAVLYLRVREQMGLMKIKKVGEIQNARGKNTLIYGLTGV